MDKDIQDLKDCADKTIKAKEAQLKQLNNKAILNKNEQVRNKTLENILPSLRAQRKGMDELDKL